MRSVLNRGRPARLALLAVLIAGCGRVAITPNGPGPSLSGGAPQGTPPGGSQGAPQGSSAPTVSGLPPSSTLAGRPFSFRPHAKDASGKPLIFSVAGQPGWAHFSSATGMLSGIPAAADVGTFNIVITVSNGTEQAQLTFRLAVVDVASGSATLSWMAPTQNTDGTAITNLAGFRIYYGTAPDALVNSIDISGVGTASWVVGNLTPGTWYFGMTAVNTVREESSRTNLVSKTIA